MGMIREGTIISDKVEFDALPNGTVIVAVGDVEHRQWRNPIVKDENENESWVPLGFGVRDTLPTRWSESSLMRVSKEFRVLWMPVDEIDSNPPVEVVEGMTIRGSAVKLLPLGSVVARKEATTTHYNLVVMSSDGQDKIVRNTGWGDKLKDSNLTGLFKVKFVSAPIMFPADMVIADAN